MGRCLSKGAVSIVVTAVCAVGGCSCVGSTGVLGGDFVRGAAEGVIALSWRLRLFGTAGATATGSSL